MSEYTRKRLNNLKEEAKIFENVGLNWLAQKTKRELEILSEQLTKKHLN